MKLDMPADEALERFIGVDPGEVDANVRRAKKKAPPGSRKKNTAKPSGDNVASLNQQRSKRQGTRG